MRFFTLKKSRNRVHHTQRYPLYAALIALAVALVVLTVMIVQKTRLEEQLRRNRLELADQAQTEVSIAMNAYNRIHLSGADLEGNLIPAMDEHLYAADRLSTILALSHGEQYGVMDHQLYLQIDQVLSEVTKHLTGGTSTTTTLEQLGTLIDKLQSEMEARYGETTLLPQTSIG